MTSETQSPAYFFGHHKAATTWIRVILGECARLCGRSMITFDSPRQFNGNLADYLSRNPVDLVAYTNANIEQVQHLPRTPGFHVIRDPRDVIVSGYFSHRSSHPISGWPELEDHRRKLQLLDREEGLIAEIAFSGATIDLMGTWDYAQTNILELKYERIILDPYASMLRAAVHIGLVTERESGVLDEIKGSLNAGLNLVRNISRGRLRLCWRSKAVPADRFLMLLYRLRFEQRTRGRKPGVEDVQSHYRKGQSGDWKNHFSNRVVAAFHERFGDLAERLGY